MRQKMKRVAGDLAWASVVLGAIGLLFLSFALAFGTFDASNVGNDGNGPKPASAGCYFGTCKTWEVRQSAAQINSLMFLAYFYGPSTAAVDMCNSEGEYPVFSPGWWDCYGWDTSVNNTYPIMQFWAHYGYGIDAQWQIPFNNYLGYYAY